MNLGYIVRLYRYKLLLIKDRRVTLFVRVIEPFRPFQEAGAQQLAIEMTQSSATREQSFENVCILASHDSLLLAPNALVLPASVHRSIL